MTTRMAVRIVFALFALAGANGAHAREKAQSEIYENGRVANFSLPAYDYSSPKFERFSFWSSPNGGRIIDYTYGTGATRVRLHELDPKPDAKSFAVRFPNGLVLDIEPRGDVLLVSDRAGEYHKTFEWQYEGPVDGRGTFCTPCVEEGEAVPFVREHFMK
jgi:hypothetical protein